MGSSAIKYMLAIGALLAVSACSSEARQVMPTAPQTEPTGDNDARIGQYQDNLYQVSQGGRYFAWYGCAGCHAENSQGALNLTDSEWRHGFGFAQVYSAIAMRHGRLDYRRRVSVEQLWQITAYVRDLSSHTPEKRRRVALDQQAEPVGDNWQGPQ
jgi:cytochrome c oxidase cbb3-type subunit 3